MNRTNINRTNILYWDSYIESEVFHWHYLKDINNNIVVSFRYKVNSGAEFVSLYVPVILWLQEFVVEKSQFQKHLDNNVRFNSVNESKRTIQIALLDVNDRLKFVTERQRNFL